MSTAVNDHITDLTLALPSSAMVRDATDEQLEQYRQISNILANRAYLEVERRKKAKEPIGHASAVECQP